METYEAPSITVLGTVHELTLQDPGCVDKVFGETDGLTLMGEPIKCPS
jgi:hypothetical protein